MSAPAIPHDPRLIELKRLRLALDEASKHLDEFEARRLKNFEETRRPVPAMPRENSLAVHIAAGMAKFRAVDGVSAVPSSKNRDVSTKATQYVLGAEVPAGGSTEKAGRGRA